MADADANADEQDLRQAGMRRVHHASSAPASATALLGRSDSSVGGAYRRSV